jgi:dGTPase
MKPKRAMIDLEGLRAVLDRRESETQMPFAAFSTKAVRRRAEKRLANDYRQAFAVDADRILHSHAYTRYIDKTQVFYLIRNDHITHRVLHVQLVSKIARTIGRFLGLNEDLIEAIALGHDIGHAPFGHDGERYLSRICHAHGIGHFLHNVQSVQFLDGVERKGHGWNLCLQTLDGILCHDGEIHEQALQPGRPKDFTTLAKEIASKKADPDYGLTPMTLEGCVVRMSDTISYIGRDIEDAIRLGVIRRTELPRASVAVLGETNGTIVFNLVTDVIHNSLLKPCVAFSPEISDALQRLKAFNLERIYLNPRIKKHLHTIQRLFEELFERYLQDVARGNRGSAIFRGFLEDMSPEYRQAHQAEEIVRDFIAGMTDQYFLQQFPAERRPQPEIC